jgi:hypothetical protein
MKTPIRQAQLFDHQGMEKSGKVCARRHAHTGEGFLDGAGAADTLPALEHQDSLAGACQVGSAGQAIVAGTDHNDVPLPWRQLGDRSREANLAEYGGCRRCEVLWR